MLLQIVGQRLAHTGFHGAYHFGVAQFGLGLALELRLEHLNRNYGREALAEVVLGDFHFHLLQHL